MVPFIDKSKVIEETRGTWAEELYYKVYKSDTARMPCLSHLCSVGK